MTAISDKYASLGGSRSFLGPPLIPESRAPDGVGRFRHYRGGSIYWTRVTGAHVVHGPIRDKWSALGWEKSVLGYPLTDQLIAPDGTGRYNHFQRGSIYWTPATGAHEVHGAIRDKWSALRWEAGILGYPLTDESTTPDGIGRFNHFQRGSIYWTPATGAHEVHGAIRDLWASLGFELSPLGYPTSDEMDTPHGFGKVSQFQKGEIYWEAGRGAYEVFPRPVFPPPDPLVGGTWEIPAFTSGVVGTHAALLHTNKMLFFAYKEPADPENPGPVPPDLGESAVLDLSPPHAITTPAYTGAGGQTEMINIFCSGHALLPDGRLLVVGGDRESQQRVRSVHLFTPGGSGGSWRHVDDCAEGRWYCTCVTLPDGRVLVVGGDKRTPNADGRNTTIEVFDPATDTLGPPVPAPAVLGFGGSITYPFAFVLPNGKLLVHGGTHTVFYDLPTQAFDGTTLELAPRPGRNSRTYGIEGTSVLLPLRPDSNPPYRARVMVMGGGGPEPVTIRTPATNTCEILDLGAGLLAWRLVAPMARPRVMPDAVLLPDETVLVMNGSSGGAADNGANPVWEAELYDPAANTWTTMAAMSVPRLYHAIALLLPDGRVLTAGTDSMWNPDPFHHAEFRIEIFSPPYLFKGTRPAISAAPAVVDPGSTFEVGTPDAAGVDAVALMRCGSVTHSFNPDQRHVRLSITGRAADRITVQAPPNGFVAPPGHYLLFLLRQGIPSVARFVQVRSSPIGPTRGGVVREGELEPTG